MPTVLSAARSVPWLNRGTDSPPLGMRAAGFQKTLGFPSQFFKLTKVLIATPQGRRLGYHTPEQVSIQEPPDSRPCVLKTPNFLGPILTHFPVSAVGRASPLEPSHGHHCRCQGRRDRVMVAERYPSLE